MSEVAVLELTDKLGLVGTLPDIAFGKDLNKLFAGRSDEARLQEWGQAVHAQPAVALLLLHRIECLPEIVEQRAFERG